MLLGDEKRENASFIDNPLAADDKGGGVQSDVVATGCLFLASWNGAFTSISFAKQHKLELYQYYVEIMKAIPHCETVEDYEALLPWNIDLVKVTTKDQ